MIDVEHLRRDPEYFRNASKAKGVAADIYAVLSEDAKVRRSQHAVDELRAQQRKLGAGVPKLFGPEKTQRLKELKVLTEELGKLEQGLTPVKELREKLLRSIPNPPSSEAPISQDESNNVVVREWGKKPTLPQPRDHVVIGEALGMLDVRRAVKLSGSRFVALRGAGAELEMALIAFARKHLTNVGFEFVLPPALVKGANMVAMGYLDGGGESETYHLKDDDLYLVGTAEQALGPMYAGETLEFSEMPKRLLGFSPSFRREAGSYGKDDKGFIRVHQFDKVEMFSFTAPDDSDGEHRRFLAWEEELVQALELPYRVVDVVTGALGHPAARKFDIEIWFPSQHRYRETHSTSNTTDFQTRRLNVRVKTAHGSVLAHAVNGTAIAMSRMWVALIENGQQPDGSVKLPKALKPFLGYDRIKPKQ